MLQRFWSRRRQTRLKSNETKRMIGPLAFAITAMLISFFPTLVVAGNEKTVALVMKALSNPFFSKMEEGARVYAQEQNIRLEVFGVERETDIERQIGIVDNLIARGYGAIVIAPVDSKKLVPICKKAIDRGIVVINIDNPLTGRPLLNRKSRFHLSDPTISSGPK